MMHKGSWRRTCSVVAMMASLLFVTPLCAEQSGESTQQNDTHRLEIESWRARRHAGLKKPNGWLTLVALEWLSGGKNRVGSAADNDIQLPGGPSHWGSVSLNGDKLRFETFDTSFVKVNGEYLPQAELVADNQGEPSLVEAGTLNFYVIFRGSYGLRVKDSTAIALREFKGVDNFPIQEDWSIDGQFIAAEKGASIEITNVLGQVNESPIFGTFEFERDGKTHSLIGLGEADSDKLWFIFADRTSGHGTYGAGRFLYSNSMPENGRLTVDFNKAYNPPCAFNPYSTCPIPPQRNRMDLMVTAGEKDFHPASG